MFHFKFGLAWTIFTTIVFALCIFIPGDVRGGVDLDVPLALFFLVFEAIGIYFTYSGLKQIMADRRTEKYGEFIYGKIIDIIPSGSSENGMPEMQAKILAYVPGEMSARIFEEIIGFDIGEYEIGQYLVLKYYNNDVNFHLIINKEKVPINIIELLENGEFQENSKQNSVNTIIMREAAYYVDPNQTRNNKKTMGIIKAIYDIIVGTVWTGITGWFFYFPRFFPDIIPTEYYKDGVPVTKEEFYSDPFGLVFIGFGVLKIIIGIVQLIKACKEKSE